MVTKTAPPSLAKIQWETSNVFIDRNTRQQPLTAEKHFYLLAQAHFKRKKKQKEDFQGSHVHSFQFTAGLFRMHSDLQGRDHYGRSHQLPQRSGFSFCDLVEHNYREKSASESFTVFNTTDFGPKTVTCS